MGEPDIYAKFAELYIAHERLKQKYAELCRDIKLYREYEPPVRGHSNAEYLLEQEDV